MPMSCLVVCRKLLFQANRGRNLNTRFVYIQNPFSKPFSKCTKNDCSSSLTVSYLENSCGLSTEAALKAAKTVHFERTTNPDSVLKLFQKYEFTNAQITTIISRYPVVLLSNPNKTLEPKIQYLKQLGFSDTDICQFLTKCYHVLLSSLENTIIPCFQLLKTLLPREENVVSAIIKGGSIEFLRLDPQKHLEPKVQILRDLGVPDSSIAKLILIGNRGCGLGNDNFSDLVKEVLEMGFDPSSKMFVYAVRDVSCVCKAKREVKMGIFRSFGWSDVEIRLAIRNHPTCMAISEEKLRIGLDFFMNGKNWEAEHLAKNPKVFSLSLYKRIIPRLNVIEFLISKSLLEKDGNLASALYLTDAKFIQKYVAKYEDRAPELLKLYQGHMSDCSMPKYTNEDAPKTEIEREQHI
ncbi:hypothetical protein IFM89_001687 [Coptis chinensis]|uniref:Uncharacterized protein n=1 Tax=Coptis chinensis TaxID=261450 RepID=A0A835LU93_9MAGN|nr:hypothetical protein IFM89_001687 [Coptis chinensis]